VVDNCNRFTKFYLPDDRFSWLREMHDSGHKVCNIGKWHLGVSRHPIPRYFDVWHGYETGWGHWFANEPSFPEPGEIQSGNDQPKVNPEECEARFRVDEETDFAIDFIRENRDNPFVCLISYYPPHGPITAPAEDIDCYRNTIQPYEQAIYHAMVHRIDSNVGRVLETVDSEGIREDTIIIFTSDHGENFPRRWNEHGKRLCYDQASNVPLVISWPGKLERGGVVKEVISNVDFGPTILDLCGEKWPSAIHGSSAKEMIQGDTSDWHGDVMVQNNPYRIWDGKHREMRERCLVTENWKLILNNMRPPELFPRGTPEIPENNRFEEREDLVDGLTERLGAWGNRTGDCLAEEAIRHWIR
jgi:arylsulfatase A-like enzyme